MGKDRQNDEYDANDRLKGERRKGKKEEKEERRAREGRLGATNNNRKS